MKKILYPTDFSPTAENAYIFALQIADHLGASIITLHAFNRPDVSNFNLPDMLKEVYDSIDLDAFENYEDIRVNDQIEAFEVEETARTV